jgi:hypothetical protein
VGLRHIQNVIGRAIWTVWKQPSARPGRRPELNPRR